MSQAGSTGHGGGAGAVFTVTGNTGGPIAPVAGNINLLTANATPVFAGTSGTEKLDFGLVNLILGSSPSAITSAVNCVGLGQNALLSITSSQNSIGIGNSSLGSLTSGSNNIGLGVSTLLITQNSSDNVALGYSALSALTSSIGQNVCIGTQCLGTISTGRSNIGLGYGAGNAYNGAESSNIVIGNAGVNGESNVMRLGTTGSGNGQQNKAFVAAVTGVTVAGSAPTAVNSSGQLSSLGFGTATQVLTSNGAATSPTWQAASSGSSTTFTAYVSAQITNPTGDGTGYTVIFDSTLNNTGAAYNTGTGVFTAPATGMYHFDTTICFNSIQTTSTSIVIQFSGSVTSVRTFQFQGPTNSLVTGTICYSGGITIPMTAADTMSVIVNVGGVAKNVSIYGGGAPAGTSTVFAGYRVS